MVRHRLWSAGLSSAWGARWRGIVAGSLLLAAMPSALRAQQLVMAARQATAAAAEGSAGHLAAMLAEAEVLLRYDLASAEELLAAALALADEHGDAVAAARAWAFLARSHAKTVGQEESRRDLEKTVEMLPADAPSAASAEVQYAFATFHWTYDNIPDCLAHLRASMDAAERAGDHAMVALGHSMASRVLDDEDSEREVLDNILGLNLRADDAFGILATRLMLTHARQKHGELSSQEAYEEFTHWRAEAERLGDRALESYVTGILGRYLVESDAALALERGRRGVELARLLGDREIITLSQQTFAEIAMAVGNPELASTAIAASIASIEGMQLAARMQSVLGTAVRIASAHGKSDEISAYSKRIEAIGNQLSRRAPKNERARYWRESSQMRTELRRAKASHEVELAARDSQYVGLAWTSVAIVLGMGALLMGLLFRAKRRLEIVNARLVEEIDVAHEARAERESLEQNLRQLERLDSLGLMAGGFAHDFNNILTGVLGNAQLLLLDREVEADTREALESIVSASRRAAGLCKDILTYARSGGVDYELIDIDEIIEGLVPIARAGFGAGIEVEVVVDTDERSVFVDRAQIEQVFLNVLINAGDAIAERGRISVRVFRSQLDGAPPSGHWFGEFNGEARDCVAVRILDTGQGMTAATIRRIFDPFFSTRFPGRGIGLASAFGILRRHGGVVCVESQPGRGSAFTIYLPRAASVPEAVAAAEPVVELQPLPRATPSLCSLVLVVDDEPSVCSVAASLLEREGCRAVVADCGVAARREFDRIHEQVDLAVIDFTMPDIDGAELAAELRRRRPDLPVVIMSGHDEAMVKAAMPDCVFLAKPLEQQSLRAALVTAARSQRRPDQPDSASSIS